MPAGKWHNRALGMSMRVEKSTAEQVRNRLEEVKKQKQGASSSAADFAPDGEQGLTACVQVPAPAMNLQRLMFLCCIGIGPPPCLMSHCCRL
jgi:hypothetical protein